MDYVVGSVAALISGNVTPNRPKLLRKALTPTKHQLSPNVTPKSEFVDDRSIFLSPSQQKKKAIIKKSPKRIFQNPDLNTTENDEDSTLTSPKTEKVKKHLEEELDVYDGRNHLKKSPSHNLNKSTEKVSPKKKSKNFDGLLATDSPTKKKKKPNSGSNDATATIKVMSDDDQPDIANSSPKKGKRTHKSLEEISNKVPDEEIEQSSPNKKKKKGKGKNKMSEIVVSEEIKLHTEETKKAKKKKKQKKSTKIETEAPKSEKMDTGNESESDSEEVRARNVANPNAITSKDTDSEHDSDDDIGSDNEQSNEKVLTNDGEKREEQSSDEEETKEDKKVERTKDIEVSEEEIKRTLFVGNVPFSSKCKKEIKKIFGQYGQIDTVRIRTIPVKDARVTPKLAVIKNELHPERSTVNVYVKFAHEDSVTKALKANNTVLNAHHLRVSRSRDTGAEHDPRCAVFLGNLPFAIEDETLRTKFEGCGEIVSVRVVRDKKTNAGKGFGYVNFASKDGVELALAMSEEDLTIKNRIIRVKRCTQFGNKAKKQITGQKFGGRQKWGKNQDVNNQGRGFQGKRQEKWSQGRPQDVRNQGQREETGAARRLMFKRKQQDTTGGPPNKIPNANKEKKPKKEFVGMTAEKKKKQKFDKDSKKKKRLSEILMKK